LFQRRILRMRRLEFGPVLISKCMQTLRLQG
jgi:hypothetical protein